ncbi:hypothetical protein GSC54_005069 [Salmonella enterica]|nr:hypothetical protein [Salmonella enterica]ELT1239495.1 hypothetical protein [Salmonella enterica]
MSVKLSKCALVLAGLLTSAGAMAAGPTDNPAVGGDPSNTITINGVIRNSTCVISSPSTKVLGFNISKADVDSAANNAVIKTLDPITIGVQSCANTPMTMTVTTTDYDSKNVTHGLFKDDKDNALYYQVALKNGAQISGGDTTSDPGYHILNVDGSASATPIKIEDTNSGIFDLTLETALVHNSTITGKNLPSNVSTTYTYDLTYS